jgi:hypothetical protein
MSESLVEVIVKEIQMCQHALKNTTNFAFNAIGLMPVNVGKNIDPNMQIAFCRLVKIHTVLNLLVNLYCSNNMSPTKAATAIISIFASHSGSEIISGFGDIIG